jgi:hypothetical protein
MTFQGKRFEMAANGIKGAVPGRQSHRQTIEYDFNLIAAFQGIERVFGHINMKSRKLCAPERSRS